MTYMTYMTYRTYNFLSGSVWIPIPAGMFVGRPRRQN
jgi:hypothetical protein